MKNSLFALILITFLLQTSYKLNADTEYKDFIINGKDIWSLTTDGTIKIFNLESGKVSDKIITNSSEILILTKDKQDIPIIADKDKIIKRYNLKLNTWEKISKYRGDIYGILFNSKNSCFAITDKGIESFKPRRFYFSTKALPQQRGFIHKWYCHYWYGLSTSFMDKHDNLWIGFGYGEWGGNVLIFNTLEKSFIIPKLNDFSIELWPVKSFFEDSNSVYLSAGLMHFSTDGAIVKLNNFSATIIFESTSKYLQTSNSKSEKIYVTGEYIGPATYNYYNKSIYFYSQNGIFKGDITKDLSKIENWEKVISPELRWRNGQPDAIGSPMNVLKLSIVDQNSFVFLTQNDGIGYYNGEILTMIK